MAFAIAYMTLGLLAVLFSHDIAEALNRFSVKFYEMFPALKKAIPLSRLAGTQQNYKSSLYYFRVLGVLMLICGVAFLGLVLLGHR